MSLLSSSIFLFDKPAFPFQGQCFTATEEERKSAMRFMSYYILRRQEELTKGPKIKQEHKSSAGYGIMIVIGEWAVSVRYICKALIAQKGKIQLYL